ncbi:hypothetical protein DITRI_Ditri11bG0093000 [Diplodiscus trichospermus]
MTLCGVSLGAVHWVGDFGGWTIRGAVAVDYQKWAATRNFAVGDFLVFKYNNQFHNVVRVTRHDFRSCNATSPIAFYSSGYDTIRLTTPGHFYFICGLPGQCLPGQKLHVNVTLIQEYLPSFASVFHHLPQLASASQALAPRPVSKEPIPGSPQTSAAPSLQIFNFWLVLVLGVLAPGFDVTGIITSGFGFDHIVE